MRYYEKEKLITPSRNESNRRRYSDNDITWLQFIKRLKDTCMPIKEIQKYAELRSIGGSTLEARMELLIQHRTMLKKNITKLQENLDNLDEKIYYYHTEIIKHNSGQVPSDKP
ncbi:MerR family transcriptional regulator [Lacrimispora sp.]|uniref:MerR family transcriptional regulator n=1 Tax=Lacrimispora sp. TaxID=2719234 RepID=UPI0028AAE083|nr:MerR family transcriptional regulator [Lacrimispora sp.]